MANGGWNKRTKDEVKEAVESFKYIYIDDYFIDPKHRRVVIKDKIGYKYDIQLSNLLSNRFGISFVEKRNPFSLENISLWLRLNNSQFELLDNNEYKGAFSKLNLYCRECNDYPKMNWNSFYNGQGCGICSGQQAGVYHNLAVQFPEIAAEWHPTKNGNLTPKDVTYGSQQKVYWLCTEGHEYFSQINGRTNMGNGCKICSDVRHESKIATELKNYILNGYKSEDEYKKIKNPDTNQWLRYDIYVYGGENPDLNGFYIEIHGLQHYEFIPYWHKTKEKFEYNKKLDKLKKNFAKKNGKYIEVDLRKVKTIEEAIELIEFNMNKT